MSRYLFKSLLYTFTAVSAYFTYTLTSELANNVYELAAYSLFGISLDILKCSLPATIMECRNDREWLNVLASTLIYCCLTSFSFYASTELVERSNIKRITKEAQGTFEYTSLETQYNNLQASYNELVSMQRITQANTQYNPLLTAQAQLMQAVIERALAKRKADKTANLKDTLLTIVLAILLEFSVIGCHISISKIDNKKKRNIAEQNAEQNDVPESSNSAHVPPVSLPVPLPVPPVSLPASLPVPPEPIANETQAKDNEKADEKADEKAIRDKIMLALRNGDLVDSARQIAKQHPITVSSAHRLVEKFRKEKALNNVSRETPLQAVN